MSNHFNFFGFFNLFFGNVMKLFQVSNICWFVLDLFMTENTFNRDHFDVEGPIMAFSIGKERKFSEILRFNLNKFIINL